MRLFCLLWIAGSLVAAVLFIGSAAIQAWQTGGSFFNDVDGGKVFYALLFAWAGTSQLRDVQRSRDRTERRARFLNGDDSAIPLALEQPADGRDHGAAPLPFELVGPSLTGASNFTVLLGCAFTTLLLLVPFAVILLAIVLSFPFNQAYPGGGSIVIFAAIGAAVLVEVPLFLGLRRLIKNPPSSRLIATEDGLVKPRGRRRQTLLPWRDARLFEVIAQSSGMSATQAFALESPTARITWYASPKTDPDRIHDFSAIVSERTGLALQTLSPELAEPQETLAEALAPQPRSRSFLIALGIFSLGLLALAAAVVGLAITGSAPLDAAIAFSLVVQARYIVPNVIKSRRYHARGAPQSSFTLSPAPEIVSQPVIASQSAEWVGDWTSPWRRLFNFAMALLYLFDFAAATAALAGISISWPWRLPARHATLPQALLAVVLFIGLVSFVFSLATALGRSKTITADDVGLRSRKGKRETRIAWNVIARVAVIPAGAGTPTFVVTSDAKASVFWSSTRERHFTPSPGAFRVTADELAAIVVQRSGKPLTLADSSSG